MKEQILPDYIVQSQLRTRDKRSGITIDEEICLFAFNCSLTADFISLSISTNILFILLMMMWNKKTNTQKRKIVRKENIFLALLSTYLTLCWCFLFPLRFHFEFKFIKNFHFNFVNHKKYFLSIKKNLSWFKKITSNTFKKKI